MAGGQWKGRTGFARSAFIEAPDRMELEIVEGHAKRYPGNPPPPILVP
jgi:hypothetical protein